MPFDPALADRIRTLVPAGATEKKMFGAHGFFLGGNVAASAYKDGGLMIRCAHDDTAALTAEPGARPMERGGKPVRGWVLVSADAVADDTALARWVARGVAFAASQPAK